MEQNKDVSDTVVVREYPVAGLLYVNGYESEIIYYLLSPVPVKTWNYGQTVALEFECVPNYTVNNLQDGTVVFPYKRRVVVGMGTSWFVEYNIDRDTIMVEENEIDY